jgi:CRISPR-associated protein Cmr4
MPILTLHTLSPLHAGTGHSPGAIDLPIARDKATGYPIVPGSGLKGAMRAHYSATHLAAEVNAVFGPETDYAKDYAGALWVGDANLVCLPVRSVLGTFGWATSPLLLHRFWRDLKEAREKTPEPVPTDPAVTDCAVHRQSVLKEGSRVYFEDLDLQARESEDAAKVSEWLAKLLFSDANWQRLFRERFCLVHDSVMSYLSTHATDVRTRVRLENDTKTVAKGALWTEEALPTESILASLVHLAPNTRSANASDLRGALHSFNDQSLRLGGDTSVGHGRCKVRILGGPA